MTVARSVILSSAALGATAALAVGSVTSAAAGTVPSRTAGAHAATTARPGGAVVGPSHRLTVAPGSHGGGGGIPRPASWPKTVPVPAGTIQGSLTLPGAWVLIITANGSISQVRANVSRLYTTHGFVNKPQPTTRIRFQNAGYTVFADLFSHDHNPRSTDMRLEVDRRKAAA